jgi:hypothetical protein
MSRRQRKRALEVRAIGRPWQSPFSSRPQIWQSEICGATKLHKRGIKSRLSRLSSHRVPDHHVFSLYKTTPNSWAWPCVDADDERCSRSAIARQAGATVVADPNGRWTEVGSIAALAIAVKLTTWLARLWSGGSRPSAEITGRHLSCYGRFRGR